MPKRKRISDELRLRRGLGLGDENHKPWIHPWDISSTGRTHRLKLTKAKNMQVALSDLERNWIVLSDFAPNVLQVMTQVALLPLERTQSLSWELNIRHPNVDGEDVTMTTDLVLKVSENGKEGKKAICIRPSTKMNNRTIEKFQIEKSYWDSLGVPWITVTEEQLDPITVKNVLFLHDYKKKESEYDYLLLKDFESAKLKTPNCSVTEFVSSVAGKRKLTKAILRGCLLHLLSLSKIRFDVSRTFSWEMRLVEFTVNENL